MSAGLGSEAPAPGGEASGPVLEVQDLVIRYGLATAVDRASFAVRRGDIFGFIGPNGAGKSSTMRVLATLQVPASGTARVFGSDVVLEPEEVRWRLGYMPDVFGLPETLTVGEYLSFQADVYALPRASRAKAVEAALALTDLGAHREKTLGALSKGTRQRLFLARTLLPEPEVLILDEPASGLDPRARIELRALLRELQAMGRTILISSHVLTELGEICNAIGVIEAGRILAAGSVGDILARLRPHLDVTFEMASGEEAARAVLAAREGVSGLSLDGSVARFAFAGDTDALADVVAAVVAAGGRPFSVRAERGTVEDVFLSVTEGQVT